MTQNRFAAFRAFLILWAIGMIVDWVYLQAYYDPHGGFRVNEIWQMLQHPYQYVIPHAKDPLADWTGLYQVWSPFYFGVFNSFITIIPLLTFSRWTWKGYGGFRSNVGRSIVLFSIGTFTWGCGNAFWFWATNCSKHWGPLTCTHAVNVPYPSWADVGYLSILPLAAIALWNLMRALGVPLRGGLRVFLPTLAGAAALTFLMLYWVPDHQYVMPHSTRLETLTSSIYTASDITLLSMCMTVLVFSRRAAGGSYFPAMVAYSLGFLSLYLADMGFFPRTAFETFYNADYTDLLYWLSMFLITTGTFMFARSEQQQLARMGEFERAMAPAPPGPGVAAQHGDAPAVAAGGE